MSAAAPVRLLPLACIKCKTPVPARPDELAWVCGVCGQGLLLNEAQRPNEGALRALDIFFSKAIPQGQRGYPFWVTRGQVTIATRQTYSGDEGKAAREFWAAPRLFYVPAWDLPLEDVVKAGVNLLREPRRMEPGSPTAFRPVVTPPADARPLAEFMIYSIEADRRDAMKLLNFDLKLEPPQLWVFG